MHLLILVLALSSASAAAKNIECWKSEGFKSRESYTKQQAQWKKLKPVSPNNADLISAKLSFDVLKKTYFENDKKLHCFIGCEVARIVNVRTSRYLGWLKEERDLNDCKSKTHFEVADYVATMWGANEGQKQSVNCYDLCKTYTGQEPSQEQSKATPAEQGKQTNAKTPHE